MTLDNVKSGILGLALLLSSGGMAKADIFVDSTCNDSVNDLGYSWYYYDDNSGVGINDRPQAAVPGTPSIIDVDYYEYERHAFGDLNDNHIMKYYVFSTVATSDGSSFITMPFTLGSQWSCSWGNASPYLGIGTRLAPEGKWIDFTGATAIKFRARSHQSEIIIRFRVQTWEIDSISDLPGDQLQGDEFGFYGTSVTLYPGDNVYEIPFEILELPGTWARDIPFNLAKCTKLSWEISTDANWGLSKDTIDIYSVAIIGDVVQSPALQVVDSTFDDDRNNFGYSWYYYDDNSGWGTNDRPQSDPLSVPSVINAPYTESPRHAFGNQNDNYLVKNYEFATGIENGVNGFGTMPFTFGSSWETSWGEAQPYVGFGTTLAENGMSSDLSGVYAISFRIRSHGAQSTLRFRVETSEIDSISNVPANMLQGDEFGYYGMEIQALPAWTEVIVPVSDLDLPGAWAREIPFNVKRCTKFSWEISKWSNPDVVSDTIDIDNVTLHYKDPGEPPQPPQQPFWNHVYPLSFLPPPSKFELATFEKGNQYSNWYAFTDRLTGGSSDITDGIAGFGRNGVFDVELSKRTGSDGKGRAINLAYNIGSNAFSPEGSIGTGCRLKGFGNSRYFNASAHHVKGIYFQYKTIGACNRVTFEVRDAYDAPFQYGISGNTWHVNLPATNGEWKATFIPFDSLRNACNCNLRALNLSKLDRIQWVVSGFVGNAGVVAVDNVYFEKGGHCSFVVDGDHRFFMPYGFQYFFKHNAYWIKHDAKDPVQRGTIAIVNKQGKLVRKVTFSNSNEIELPVKKLPAGMYLLKVSAINSNGNNISKQYPISIH